MTEQQLTEPKIDRAVAHLQGLIQGRYPEATFQTYRGDDPEGVYLDAIVDVEDTDEVMDLIIDPLLDIQVEQGLPVYVIALRPIERVVEELRAERALGRRRYWGQTPVTP